MRFRNTLTFAALGAPVAGPLGSLVGALGGAVLDYRSGHHPGLTVPKIHIPPGYKGKIVSAQGGKAPVPHRLLAMGLTPATREILLRRAVAGAAASKIVRADKAALIAANAALRFPPTPAMLARIEGAARALNAAEGAWRAADPAGWAKADLADRIASRAAATLAQGKKLALIARRPSVGADSHQQAAFLNQYGLRPREVYPEFGWYVSRASPLPPKPADYHAHWTWNDGGDALAWWDNHDGVWGWSHQQGGFDVGRTLNSALSVVGTLADDAIHGRLNDLENILVSALWQMTNTAVNVVVADIPWQDISDAVEAAVSNVPLLGTAVSDIIATAEVLYEFATTGNKLEFAIKAAYAYLMASTPDLASLRPVLDDGVDGLLKIAFEGVSPTHAVIDELLAKVPDHPSIAGYSPRSIVASLAAVLMHKMGIA